MERVSPGFLSAPTARWLFGRARSAIEAAIESAVVAEPSGAMSEAERHLGCFVTIKYQHSGELRGCMGRFGDCLPLWACVDEMAVAAALRDPRFPSLPADELKRCTLELSVLSELTQADPQHVEVGLHGLVVQQGQDRGVLLPQVATEHRWTREEFLRQTCQKAGLSAQAWQESQVTIETFTAEVWSESQL